MQRSEIEYIDSDEPPAHGHQPDREVVAGSWLSTLLAVAGWLVVAAAVVAAVGMALTYRPTKGDPMRPTLTGYVSERGVPPAADLLLGTVGVVLGLSLVAFGRLLEHSATMVSELGAIRGLLTVEDSTRNAVQPTDPAG